MSQLYTPFRYDFVGSFLRPEYLKKARADYEAGAMSAEELKKTEDKAITELVAKQKEAGYHVITDGEFRRATWHLDFMWAFDGVGHSKTETGLPFHGEAAMIDDTYVTGKISYKKNHPFVEHFKFVKALEDENTVAKADHSGTGTVSGTDDYAFCMEQYQEILRYAGRSGKGYCRRIP